MKILIIGSNSIVGRAIGDALSSQHSITYAGRRSADIKLDLALPPSGGQSISQFDVVILSAGVFGGDTEQEFLRSEQINAMGTLNACCLARHCCAKHFILISSISAGYVSKDVFFDSYALSKRHSEELAELYCQKFNIPLTVLRPSAIYDAQSTCRKHQRLFYHIIDQAQHSRKITLYGTKNAKRSFIYLDDLANVMVPVVDQRIIGRYNCTQRSIRVKELALAACKVFNSSSEIVFDESKPDISDVTVKQLPSIFKVFPSQATTSLYSGIRKIKIYRENNG